MIGMQKNFNGKDWSLGALIVFVTAGAFYLTYHHDFSSPIIVMLWIVWMLITMMLAYFTKPGQAAYAFAQAAKIELQKVVWPTRQETIQTTFIVMAMVGVTGLMLWVFDVFILWGIAKLTHLG